MRIRMPRLRRLPHPGPRPTPWRLLLACLAFFVTAQASVLGVLLASAARRQARARRRPFPHLKLPEIQTGENALQIYSYGQDLFAAMLEAIDGARESIYIESFIWKDDAVGREFKKHLARKAAEGVQVFAIFDTFGNLVVPREFKRFPPGIHLVKYWAVRRPWHLLDPRRYALDHRKLLVVDGEIGFIGGYNLGSLYATEWRDTHLCIRGPAALDLAQAFVAFWNRSARPAQRIHRHFARRFDPTICLRGNDTMRLTFPIRDMYIDAIDRAQHHIYLTNAYFIPDHVLLESLMQAAQRGVDVQILVPRRSNHVLADWAAHGYFAACMRAGIRIFGYRDAMIHAKTCTIDGQWSTIGTANLDRLSSVGNYEINVEIYSTELARQMERLFACDKTNAEEITEERWSRRPWYVKLSEGLLAPLRVAV